MQRAQLRTYCCVPLTVNATAASPMCESPEALFAQSSLPALVQAAPCASPALHVCWPAVAAASQVWLALQAWRTQSCACSCGHDTQPPKRCVRRQHMHRMCRCMRQAACSPVTAPPVTACMRSVMCTACKPYLVPDGVSHAANEIPPVRAFRLSPASRPLAPRAFAARHLTRVSASAKAKETRTIAAFVSMTRCMV